MIFRAAIRLIIVGETLANVEVIKWYLSLNMIFCKSTSRGIKADPAVTFGLKVFKSIDIHDLNYLFHVGYNQIVLQIAEF